MTTFEEKFREKLEKYAQHYRVEDLNDANDRTLLEIMLKTEIMIDGFQEEIQEIMMESAADRAGDLKKLADLLRDATNTITNLQRTLAIDRKSRKGDESGSVAEYIAALKIAAKEFVDERLTRVVCPTCNVMVGRFAPVHNHTSFIASFQCSQCKKMVRARRDERDAMFDIKPSDREWRRKYRAEIVQPARKKASDPAAKPEELNEFEDPSAIVLDFASINDPVEDQVKEDLEL